MPRAPNPLEKKAEKLYRGGMKTAAIAEKLGVPAGTVRRWKAAGNWDSERSESSDKVSTKKTSTKKKTSAQNQRGAPPGNKNAVGNSGGGAPLGNTNNYRHGFYYDVLKPEEQAFVDSPDSITEAQRLLNEMALCEIRERNLLQLLAELQAVPTGLAVQSVTKFKKDTSTTALTTKEYILRYEGLLNQTQRTHMRCVKELHQIKLDLEKLELLKKKMGYGDEETMEKLDAVLKKLERM